MHRSCMHFLALVLALPGVDASAQANRPPSGRAVDETRIVKLASEIPARCISFESNGVTIVLDRDRIDEFAALARDPHWKTEEDRLALIKGDRARELLARLSGDRDTADCFRLLSIAQTDAMYLVVELLEEGSAGIYSTPDGALQQALQVRYLGLKAGPTVGRGEIHFRLPGRPQPFMVISWWAS